MPTRFGIRPTRQPATRTLPSASRRLRSVFRSALLSPRCRRRQATVPRSRGHEVGRDLTSTFSRAAQSYCHLSAAPNHSPAGPRPGAARAAPPQRAPSMLAGRLPSPGSRSAGAKGRPHAAPAGRRQAGHRQESYNVPAASQSSGGESTTEPPRRRAKAVLPLAVMVPRLHLNKPLGRDPPSPAAAVRCSGQDPARSMPLHRGRSVPVGGTWDGAASGGRARQRTGAQLPPLAVAASVTLRRPATDVGPPALLPEGQAQGAGRRSGLEPRAFRNVPDICQNVSTHRRRVHPSGGVGWHLSGSSRGPPPGLVLEGDLNVFPTGAG